jgi:hypothetical protein
MTHHDDPHHHHHHTHESGGGLSLEEKLERLLSHWIDHNGDHANTYRDWAAQAGDHDLARVGELLLKAADLTEEISRQFEAARQALPSAQ